MSLNIFSSNSFDATASLSLMYLWMTFAFFTVLLSCDLQRIAYNNVYLQHLFAFAALFFLITIVDPNNTMSVLQTWQKTIIVYILFLMSTKAKWPFIASLIIALMLDLTYKTHIAYKEKRNEDVTVAKEIRKYIRALIFIIILVGFVHYTLRAVAHHRKNFSWVKFVFGTSKCQK